MQQEQKTVRFKFEVAKRIQQKKVNCSLQISSLPTKEQATKIISEYSPQCFERSDSKK